MSPEELDALTSGMSGLSIDSRNIAKELTILKLLDYGQRDARHESISSAHERTFRWIFPCSPESSNDHARFTRWLKTSDGPFWISGKPGCGKSTLMKFIAGSDMIHPALREWAGPKQVFLASHYFWSVGTPIQKSLEGLMRSLLSDVCRQAPDLISKIFHKEWSMPLAELQRQHWSSDQLQSLLHSVVLIPELPVNFCFLIDGLDEYEGDHLEICQTLLELSRSPQIKLCVSSRPWNVFEDYFGSNPATKLYVHELTRKDIREYARSRLAGHYRREILDPDDNTLRSLVENITNMAQGVFLWVFLVTRTLREGLTNDDSIADLHKRLESFPTNLEPFFKHLLSSVDEFYHEKMAGALRMALAAGRPLKQITYAFQDLEFEDDQYALNMYVRALDADELNSTITTTRRRLNGRCKGLLEIHPGNGRVQFLHRTVRDFLGTAEMTEFLTQKTKPGFDPLLSLLRAQIATVKRTMDHGRISYLRPMFYRYSSGSPFILALTEALECAGLCDELEEAEHLLDNLESASEKMSQTGQISLTSITNPQVSPTVLFREHVLSLNLHHYLFKKLSTSPRYLDNMQIYASLIASQSIESTKFINEVEVARRRPDTLKCLFAHGCDPNGPREGSHSSSIWQDLIANPSSRASALKLGTLTVFLQHGADVNAMTPSIRKSGPVPVWFKFILTAFTDTIVSLDSVQYIQALRQIFTSRPEVDWLLSADVPGTEKEGQRTGAVELLGIYIRESNKGNNGRKSRSGGGASRNESSKGQVGFLAEVIAELARWTGEKPFWEGITPDVEKAFSPDQTRVILDIIASRRRCASVSPAHETRL